MLERRKISLPAANILSIRGKGFPFMRLQEPVFRCHRIDYAPVLAGAAIA
jgi:hypothetical protein